MILNPDYQIYYSGKLLNSKEDLVKYIGLALKVRGVTDIRIEEDRSGGLFAVLNGGQGQDLRFRTLLAAHPMPFVKFTKVDKD